MFNRLLGKHLDRENRLLDREYHLTRMYTQMVKFATQFMSEEEKQKWLTFNDPVKMDGNISFVLGGTDWATELDLAKINYTENIV